MRVATPRTVVAGVLLGATALTIAGASSASAGCQGGLAGPVKPVLHAAEEPVSGTPGERLIHTVECALP